MYYHSDFDARVPGRYVFGDGDPNLGLEASAVRAAATAIRLAGGAVTAQQLLPFVPAPPSEGAAQQLLSSTVVDEQFVLPLVSKLGGVPVVTRDGDIVYQFEEVSLTAGGAASAADGDLGVSGGWLEEEPAVFSTAGEGNLVLAGALGALNLAGALYLGASLADFSGELPGALGAVQAGYPLLLAYAAAFNLAPLVRKLGLEGRNRGIASRNAVRRTAAEALRMPSGDLKASC